ncbi:uncharacterized protein [Rutidosis leptorrhynchoides]|uniref:uncharacterized protein n=1 Tax=Rutidosis leptorrhynchoides TaxID=125765 RepID=UPI003A994C02
MYSNFQYPFYYASKEVNASTQPVMNVDQQTTQLADESDKGDRVRGPALMRKIWKQNTSVRIPISTKFDYPQTADSWILRSYGQKMKNWRARIKEAYFDPSLSMEAMSDKNKANRANKKLTQLTGKKSFTRIREELKTSFGREPTRVDMFKKCFTNGSADGEAATVLKQMKELTDKLVDGQTDTPGPDDVFSQVMGPNNSGSAQTYGLGVRAKDLWGVVPGRSAKNNGSGVENEGLGHQDNGSVVKRLKVRDEVYVKSITKNKVARGKSVSMNPTTVVLQTELGAGWCEVELQVSIERNEVLFRPYEHMRYIHDVIGTSTAWPTALIEVCLC